MNSIVTGMVVGAVGGAVVAAAWGLLQPAKKCPECGTPLPKYRKSQSKQQALWGGWTCQRCGCEVDRTGNRRTD